MFPSFMVEDRSRADQEEESLFEGELDITSFARDTSAVSDPGPRSASAGVTAKAPFLPPHNLQFNKHVEG